MKMDFNHPTSLLIQELRKYPLDYISQSLHCSDEATLKILNKLEKKKILTLEEKNGLTTISFGYVGILYDSNVVFKCYPKYIKSSDELKINSYLSTVLDILEDKEIKEALGGLSQESSPLLEIIVYLLKDYFVNGLYTNETIVINNSPYGNIDWHTTINKKTPLLNQGDPYYDSFYVKSKKIEDYNYFRLLHCAILKKCSDIAQSIRLGDVIKDISYLDDFDYTLDDFEEIKLIISKIEKELLIQFDSRRISVLKSMLAFLKMTSNENYSDDFYVYGTSKFEVVWEKVIKNVFCDDLDKKIGNILSVPSTSKYFNETLKSLIEKPMWNIAGNSIPSISTLIPDFVKIEEGNILYIMDAKYYDVPNYAFVDSKNLPGIDSITKQFLYLKCYEVLKKELPSLKIENNYFLFPCENTYGHKWIYDAGNVTFESIFPSNKIACIFVDANVLFQKYLRRSKVNFYKEI